MKRMSRLPLGQVTLCAVETRVPALAVKSLQQSMSRADFGRVVLFTHDWLPRCVLPGIELIDIGPLSSDADHSDFMLRRLPAYIRSSHVLVTSWDGFVTDTAAWTDEFLVHDYVGPVWPDAPAGQRVGGGAFSLRSRRLLAAGMDPRITELHPEDHMLCGRHRQLLERQHGVSFAPEALARRFAVGDESVRGPCFGFHGPQHLPRVLDEPTVAQWLSLLPGPFYRGAGAQKLVAALLAHGMTTTARELVQHIHAAGQGDTWTRLLGAVAALMGMVKPGPAARPR